MNEKNNETRNERKTLPFSWEYGQEEITLKVSSYAYGNGLAILMYRQEEGELVKLNIKKERIRKWRRSSGCYFRNRDWQSGKSRSVYAMKCWILCWENRLPCVMQG